MFDHLSYLLENSSVGLGRQQRPLFLSLPRTAFPPGEGADGLLKVFPLLQLEICDGAAGDVSESGRDADAEGGRRYFGVRGAGVMSHRALAAAGKVTWCRPPR